MADRYRENSVNRLVDLVNKKYNANWKSTNYGVTDKLKDSKLGDVFDKKNNVRIEVKSTAFISNMCCANTETDYFILSNEGGLDGRMFLTQSIKNWRVNHNPSEFDHTGFQTGDEGFHFPSYDYKEYSVSIEEYLNGIFPKSF